MKKACIFDLDGTLLFTLDSMMRPANRMLRELGLTEQPREAYRYFCGEGAAMLTKRALIAGGDPEASLFEKAYPLYLTYFEADPLYQVEPFEGIPELLKELKQRGIKLSVCSNKPAPGTQKIISTLFPGMFDFVVGQSDALKRKPAPDMPLAVLSHLGITAQECLYIGDSGTDMQTGKAAGLKTIGVLWGYRTKEELLENGADGLAETPKDILAYLS